MIQTDFLRERVNSFLGCMLVIVFGLGAVLIIWQTETGQNPLASAFASAMESQSDN